VHAWSPDGQYLAILLTQQVLSPNIFGGVILVYDRTTSQSKKVAFGTCQAGAGTLRWSPDSKKLLFSALAASTVEEDLKNTQFQAPNSGITTNRLFIYDYISQNLSKYGDQAADFGSWSPDGRRFLALLRPPQDTNDLVALMQSVVSTGALVVDDKDKRTVLASPIEGDPRPIWLSNDRILYHKALELPASEKRLFVANLTSGDTREITDSFLKALRESVQAKKKKLISLVKAANPQLAWKAYRTLIWMNAPETLQLEADLLKGEGLAGVRVLAVDSFFKRRGQEGIPTLVNLVNDPEKRVRKRAIAHLGDTKAALAIQALEGLLSNPNADIASASCEALRDIGDPSVIPAIERAMEQATTDKKFYQNAIDSLRKKANEPKATGKIQ
jgi:hypothetical protein